MTFDVASAREARRRLISGLLAVKPHLDAPYPDDNRWTPWQRFVERELGDVEKALSDACDEIEQLRKELWSERGIMLDLKEQLKAEAQYRVQAERTISSHERSIDELDAERRSFKEALRHIADGPATWCRDHASDVARIVLGVEGARETPLDSPVEYDVTGR